MSASSFHFKQFTIHQDKCAMKVGTDAVLLGAWVDTTNAQNILDIGTGTGIIAIMLAQKSNAKISAIDIDINAYQQAVANIQTSPWADKLEVFHSSLQDFAGITNNKYDLIVSNPPYFVDAYKTPVEARNKARHTNDSLSFDDLIAGVKQLLTPEGRFCLILPHKEGEMFEKKAVKNGFFCTKIMHIKGKKEKPEKRMMMQYSTIPKLLIQEELIIQLDDYNYSPEYIELTKDYYLTLTHR